MSACGCADLTPGNVLLKASASSVLVKLAVSLGVQGTRAQVCSPQHGVLAAHLRSNPSSRAQDFGLSNRLDGQATHVSGFGAGTPFYVAPEVRDAVSATHATCLVQAALPHVHVSSAPQVVLQRRSSTASDIFSLGVIAWCVGSLLAPSTSLLCAPAGGALQCALLVPGACREVLSRQSPDVPDATGAFKPNPLFPKFPPGLKPPAEVQALITR